MNKVYRVVYNQATRTWQAVAEFAKSRTKSKSSVDADVVAVSESVKKSSWKKLALATALASMFSGVAMAQDAERVDGGDAIEFTMSGEDVNPSWKYGINGVEGTDGADTTVNLNTDNGLDIRNPDGDQATFNNDGARLFNKADNQTTLVAPGGITATDGKVNTDISAGAIAIYPQGTTDPNNAVLVTADGFSNAGNQIKNIADGSDDTDAVSFGQLKSYVADNAAGGAIEAADDNITVNSQDGASQIGLGSDLLTSSATFLDNTADPADATEAAAINSKGVGISDLNSNLKTNIQAGVANFYDDNLNRATTINADGYSSNEGANTSVANAKGFAALNTDNGLSTSVLAGRATFGDNDNKEATTVSTTGVEAESGKDHAIQNAKGFAVGNEDSGRSTSILAGDTQYRADNQNTTTINVEGLQTDAGADHTVLNAKGFATGNEDSGLSTSTLAGNTQYRDGNSGDTTTVQVGGVNVDAAADHSTQEAKGFAVINADAQRGTQTTAGESLYVDRQAQTSAVVNTDGVSVVDAKNKNDAVLLSEGLALTSAGKQPVVLSNEGLNNGNNKIEGVAAGEADTDAVNVFQLNQVQNKLNDLNGSFLQGVTGDENITVNDRDADGNQQISLNQDLQDLRSAEFLNDSINPTEAAVASSKGYAVANPERGLVNEMTVDGNVVSNKDAGETSIQNEKGFAVADTDAQIGTQVTAGEAIFANRGNDQQKATTINYDGLGVVDNKAGLGTELTERGVGVVDAERGLSNEMTADGNTVSDGEIGSIQNEHGFAAVDKDAQIGTQTTAGESLYVDRKNEKSAIVGTDGISVVDAKNKNDAVLLPEGLALTSAGKQPVVLSNEGLDNGNNKILNVAEGTEATDAVNFSQLSAVQDQLDDLNDNAILGIDGGKNIRTRDRADGTTQVNLEDTVKIGDSLTAGQDPSDSLDTAGAAIAASNQTDGKPVVEAYYNNELAQLRPDTVGIYEKNDEGDNARQSELNTRELLIQNKSELADDEQSSGRYGSGGLDLSWQYADGSNRSTNHQESGLIDLATYDNDAENSVLNRAQLKADGLRIADNNEDDARQAEINASHSAFAAPVTGDVATLDAYGLEAKNGDNSNIAALKSSGLTFSNINDDGSKVVLSQEGLDNGGNRIINVEAGKDQTDAVNVSQLEGLRGDFKNFADNAGVINLENGENTTLGTADDGISTTVEVNQNLKNLRTAEFINTSENETQATDISYNGIAVSDADTQRGTLTTAGESTYADANTQKVTKINPESVSVLDNQNQTLAVLNDGGLGVIDKNANQAAEYTAADNTFATLDNKEASQQSAKGFAVINTDENRGTQTTAGQTLYVNKGANGDEQQVTNINYDGLGIVDNKAGLGTQVTTRGVGVADENRGISNEMTVDGNTVSDGRLGSIQNEHGFAVIDKDARRGTQTTAGESVYADRENQTSAVVNTDGISVVDAKNKNDAVLLSEGISFTSAGKQPVFLGNEGLNNGNNKIEGVAAGEADTDAVNVFQLHQVQNQLDDLDAFGGVAGDENITAGERDADGKQQISLNKDLKDLNSAQFTGDDGFSFQTADRNGFGTKDGEFSGQNAKGFETIDQNTGKGGALHAGEAILADNQKEQATVVNTEGLGVVDNANQIGTSVTTDGLRINQGDNNATPVELTAKRGLTTTQYDEDGDAAVSSNVQGGSISVDDFNDGTSSQLTSTFVQFDNPEGASVNLSNEGLDNGGNKIVNVAAGENDTDAVNVSQLNELGDKFDDLAENAVTNLGNKDDNLRIRPGIVDGEPGTVIDFDSDLHVGNSVTIGDERTSTTDTDKVGIAMVKQNVQDGNPMLEAYSAEDVAQVRPDTVGLYRKGTDGENTAQAELTSGGLDITEFDDSTPAVSNFAAIAEPERAAAKRVTLDKDGLMVQDNNEDAKANYTADGVIVKGNNGQPVILGKDGLNNGNNKIEGVAAGTYATDAVNVSQLEGLRGDFSTMASQAELARVKNGVNTNVERDDPTGDINVNLNRDLTDLSSAEFVKDGAQRGTMVNGDGIGIIDKDSGLYTSNEAGITLYGDGTDQNVATANVDGFGVKAGPNTSALIGGGLNVVNDDEQLSTAAEAGNITLSDARNNEGATANTQGFGAKSGDYTAALKAQGLNVLNNEEQLSTAAEAGNITLSDARNNEGATANTQGFGARSGASTAALKAQGLNVLNDDEQLSTAAEAGIVTVSDAKNNQGATLNSQGVGVKSGDKLVALTADGLNNGNNRIEGVKEGVNDTDAVNVFQLKQATSNLDLDGIVSKAEAGKVSAGDNINVTRDGDNVNVGLNRDLENLSSAEFVKDGAQRGTMVNGDGVGIIDKDSGLYTSEKAGITIFGDGTDQNVATANVDGFGVKAGPNNTAVKGAGLNVINDDEQLSTAAEAGNIMLSDARNNEGATVNTQGFGAKSGDFTSVVRAQGLNVLNDKDQLSTAAEAGIITLSDAANNEGATLNTQGVGIKSGDKLVALTADGLNNGNNRIEGVKEGVNDTDAVNVFQLKGLRDDFGTMASKAELAKVVQGDNITVDRDEQTGDIKVGLNRDLENLNSAEFVKDGAQRGTMVNGDGVGIIDKDSGLYTSEKAGITIFGDGTDQNVATANVDGFGVKAGPNTAALNGTGLGVVNEDQGLLTSTQAGLITLSDKENNEGATINTQGVGVKSGTNTAALNSSGLGVVNEDQGLLTTTQAGVITLSDKENDQGATVNTQGFGVQDGDKIVTLTGDGLNNGNNRIVGVLAGEDDTDAVNVSQLNQLRSDFANLAEAGGASSVASGDNTTVETKDGVTRIDISPDLDGLNSAKFSDDNTPGQQAGVSSQGVEVIDENTGRGTSIDAGSAQYVDRNSLATTTVDSNGVTMRDPVNGNTGITTAGGSQFTDAAGNVGMTTASASQFQDAAGNAARLNAQGLTIASPDGGTVSLTSGGLNNGGNRIQNVGNAVMPTDAVNLGQLNAMSDGLNDEISRRDRRNQAGIASAIAAAGLMQAYNPNDKMVSVGGGVYRGEAGYALGVSAISENGKWGVKATATGDSRNNFGGSASVGYIWR